jgi:hypothetical protein
VLPVAAMIMRLPSGSWLSGKFITHPPEGLNSLMVGVSSMNVRPLWFCMYFFIFGVRWISGAAFVRRVQLICGPRFTVFGVPVCRSRSICQCPWFCLRFWSVSRPFILHWVIIFGIVVIGVVFWSRMFVCM